MMTNTSTAQPAITKVDFAEHCQEIAKILGWHVVPADHMDRMNVMAQEPCTSTYDPKSRLVPKIYLSIVPGLAKSGMIHVSGSWPRDSKGDQYSPGSAETSRLAIQVSLKKTAAQVAKEISQRFLGRYLAAHKQQVDKASDWDKHRENGAQLAGRLAAVTGDRVVPRSSAAGSAHHFWANDDYTVSVSCRNDRVRMELTLDESQAVEVLKLLREIGKVA